MAKRKKARTAVHWMPYGRWTRSKCGIQLLDEKTEKDLNVARHTPHEKEATCFLCVPYVSYQVKKRLAKENKAK